MVTKLLCNETRPHGQAHASERRARVCPTMTTIIYTALCTLRSTLSSPSKTFRHKRKKVGLAFFNQIFWCTKFTFLFIFVQTYVRYWPNRQITGYTTDLTVLRCDPQGMHAQKCDRPQPQRFWNHFSFVFFTLHHKYHSFCFVCTLPKCILRLKEQMRWISCFFFAYLYLLNWRNENYLCTFGYSVYKWIVVTSVVLLPKYLFTHWLSLCKSGLKWYKK